MVDLVTPISLNLAPIQAASAPASIKVEKVKPAQPAEKSSRNNSKAHEEAAREVATHLQQSDLKIRTDASTGRTFFQIISKKGEVLMQVPSEEVLAMARKIKEMEKDRAGILMDKEG